MASHDLKPVEGVYTDFRRRREALLKALTVDAEEFSRQCDPEKESLSLYGYPNESWVVQLPVENVPAELPEPSIGINFPRDGMEHKHWLSLVALHSDAWLYAVAFYYGSQFDRDQSVLAEFLSSVKILGSLHLPLFEIVSSRNSASDKSIIDDSRNQTEIDAKTQDLVKGTKPSKTARLPSKEDDIVDDEDDEENDHTFCGICRRLYCSTEFWICYDITASKAHRMEEFVCPSCSPSKKARTDQSSIRN
ncbi:hypothetical protein O6H91_07G124400 [Diphasiastrum complanatum]|uniref:Uncharacterized protein n=1 Tax=Diphasiastrum complanatum TaxID=34168 RepID=A0ACC2D9L1_DIPCM|nr:hypothetical protein O6H91_07G124400 [Diphasiastrum complanatum]